ncbi:hypothetical protein EVAR_89218_1 [Eumeta japonica]|uniref:Uncharacterized protein n=1 Tax=Eumeta variegata TaxID=151549 RepID=A0A4C2A7I2_EUMVA|nr:hypothetical protein EVAR_89218_1 [Eumeta japonica]
MRVSRVRMRVSRVRVYGCVGVCCGVRVEEVHSEFNLVTSELVKNTSCGSSSVRSVGSGRRFRNRRCGGRRGPVSEAQLKNTDDVTSEYFSDRKACMPAGVPAESKEAVEVTLTGDARQTRS